MIVSLTIFGFIFGSIIGSFLNVVILRLNTDQGLGGRSSCMSCHTQLAWYELVPVFSYIFLRGKCKTCKETISKQYVIVEFLTGLLFAGVVLRFTPLLFSSFISDFIIQIILWMILVSFSMVIAVYDIKHKLIDVRFLAMLAITSIFLGVYDVQHIGIISHIIGAIIVPLPFLLLWIMSKGRLIGFGDIEIMAITGFLFGAISGFSAVTVAFWIATISVFLVIGIKSYKQRKIIEQHIAFAPFLLAGIYLVGICGFDIFARILGMM
jgi:leader peptidase (prepilin peptidase)/N-methyltransferase